MRELYVSEGYSNNRLIYAINTSDFFNNQFIDGEFRRMEVIIRYLFIENYFGENDFGRDFYLRVGWDENYAKQFDELIESFKKDGYRPEYPIPVINDFMRDGAHRFACSLYFNVPHIFVTPSSEHKLYDKVSRFGRDWLSNINEEVWKGKKPESNLKTEEIEMLYNKLEEIRKKINA